MKAERLKVVVGAFGLWEGGGGARTKADQLPINTVQVQNGSNLVQEFRQHGYHHGSLRICSVKICQSRKPPLATTNVDPQPSLPQSVAFSCLRNSRNNQLPLGMYEMALKQETSASD